MSCHGAKEFWRLVDDCPTFAASAAAADGNLAGLCIPVTDQKLGAINKVIKRVGALL